MSSTTHRAASWKPVWIAGFVGVVLFGLWRGIEVLMRPGRLIYGEVQWFHSSLMHFERSDVDGQLLLRPDGTGGESDFVVRVRDGRWFGYLPPWWDRDPSGLEVVRGRLNDSLCIAAPLSPVDRDSDGRWRIFAAPSDGVNLQLRSNDPNRELTGIKVYRESVDLASIDAFAGDFPRPDFASLTPVELQWDDGVGFAFHEPRVFEEVSSVYWIGAEGHAWKRATLNDLERIDVELELDVSAQVDLSIVGRLQSTALRFQLYHLLKGSLAWRYEEQVVELGNSASFTALPPGSYWLSIGSLDDPESVLDEPLQLKSGEVRQFELDWSQREPINGPRYQRWRSLEQEPYGSPRQVGFGSLVTIRIELDGRQVPVTHSWLSKLRAYETDGRQLAPLRTVYASSTGANEGSVSFIVGGDWLSLQPANLESGEWLEPIYMPLETYGMGTHAVVFHELQ